MNIGIIILLYFEIFGILENFNRLIKIYNVFNNIFTNPRNIKIASVSRLKLINKILTGFYTLLPHVLEKKFWSETFPKSPLTH